MENRNIEGWRDVLLPDGSRGRAPVPNDCERCGSTWTIEDEGGGARYRAFGRWLCATCLEIHYDEVRAAVRA